MKLLRDLVFFRRLRSRVVARRTAAQRAWTITVPAPLAADGGNVVALRRPAPDAVAVRRAADSGRALPLLARAAGR